MKRFPPVLALFALTCVGQTRPFLDNSHPSTVFGEERRYRIFLPRGYEDTRLRYPVIYYFHGHSDR